MDVSAMNSLLSLCTASYEFDTSGVASKMTTRLLTNRDSDGDGYLTNDDVSELSSDQFSQLDSDGDGLLSSDEITSAFEGQLSSLQTVAKNGLSIGGGTLSVLKKSPAGLLMQASRTANPSSSSDTTSTTSTSSSSSSSSSSTALDVTA